MGLSKADKAELKEFLNAKSDQYNRPSFVEEDPVSIPHRYEQKEDIEIAAFLTAVISWGRRDLIIRAAGRFMDSLPSGPFAFIMDASAEELQDTKTFAYRTFLPEDAVYFLLSLQNIYRHHGGLEEVITEGYLPRHSVRDGLEALRKVFFELPGPLRTRKHIADVASGSSGKRLNMFLRWMVRDDGRGVDFGLWKSIRMSDLQLPLDVHTGNVARKLGMLQRKANDWKAVEEVGVLCREFDPQDPVKYDFALFGLGIYENL